MLMHLVIGFLITVVAFCPSTPTLSVEEILDYVEKSDVSSVTADVYYSRTDPILERKEIRTGKIIFKTSDGNNREAAILFDIRIIGRRREDRQKHYIFSGRWMVEIDHEQKQFIKRELVAPGENGIDPFELGSGPIPLPIGQSKESVLKQFTVEKITIPTEGLLSKLDNSVVGLHLVPREGDEWEYIDLFYDPTTWLPVGVRTVEQDGTKRVSHLTNIQLNALSDEDELLLSIKTPDNKEWSIDIRPWSGK